MCGYIGNTHDDPTLDVIEILKDHPAIVDIIRDIAGAGPAASIDIITERDGQLYVDQAIWWLLLEPKPDGGHKPSKYTSFNTRSDKLNTPRSAGYHPYRHTRCIIPATYIIEGEGPKNARQYHKISPTQQQFALGGLYREWVNKSTGEMVRSCSVITLPPHPAWRGIHSKSTPLFLPQDHATQARWLSADITDVAEFSSLLEPAFPEALRCVPVRRPSEQTPTGDAIFINPD